MKEPSPAQIREKRAEAQAVEVTLHVGKEGVTEATTAELAAQLRKRRLVKVRFLPAASAAAQDGADAVERLAKGTESRVVDRRGSTAVFWRP